MEFDFQGVSTGRVLDESHGTIPKGIGSKHGQSSIIVSLLRDIRFPKGRHLAHVSWASEWPGSSQLFYKWRKG